MVGIQHDWREDQTADAHDLLVVGLRTRLIPSWIAHVSIDTYRFHLDAGSCILFLPLLLLGALSLALNSYIYIDLVLIVLQLNLEIVVVEVFLRV